MTRSFPAPAKLNWRLRIVGSREDGMHLLESDAALVEFGDVVRIDPRRDGEIRRLWPHADVADDLCVRAARALRAEAGAAELGADIFVEKRIPIGGGMGGASSNAATTLLALNRLWGLDFSRQRLTALGVKLGADIPLFLSGFGAARMEGIGEKISEIKPTGREEKAGGEGERDGVGGSGWGVGWESGWEWVVAAHPGVSAGTAEVYGVYDSGADLSELTSGLKSAIITLSRWNDLAEAACFLRPEIAECALALAKAGGAKNEARMTGGGACVYSGCKDFAEAERIRNGMEKSGWTSWTTRLLDSHPLRDYAG